MKILKELHEKYGLKVQLNLFYRTDFYYGNDEFTLAEMTDAYKKEIQSLEADILHATDFYDKLFSDVSEKGYKVLKDFYAQAKETLDNAQVSADGVVVEVPVKDADGKFVKKAVKLTVAEFEKMKQQVISIQRELEKKNPFAAFKTSWSDLMKAMKNGDSQVLQQLA